MSPGSLMLGPASTLDATTVNCRRDQDIMETEENVLAFLKQFLSQDSDKTELPLVTLTFAQSVDAKIAGAKGRQLTLSCEESMIMTHRFEKWDALP